MKTGEPLSIVCINDDGDDFEGDDNLDDVEKYLFGNHWNEMSWNKYKDNLLDYGEESEWDMYLEEENIYS